ncbi:hypothetical protein [Bacillus tuaregi]|uniref:hypothetical protein n=1 Tax=Bacillus tuaregi TaxID=1816695 RepID=UPI0008F837D8|nr:hypothetical protein [Bacillus tuaregi]
MKWGSSMCKRRGSFYTQIKHDLLIGILHEKLRYVPVFLIFIFSCVYFQNMVDRGASHEITSSIPSYSDYIIQIFKGMEIYQENRPFEIPVTWLLINIYIVYLVSYYPFQDLNGYGQLIILHSKNRKQWWLSKCIWNISTVLTFYLIGYIVVFLFTLLSGDIAFQRNEDINLLVSRVNTANFQPESLLIIGFILPIITSIAISLFQMTLTLFCRPIFSCIIVITLLVASAYSSFPLLIGNYLMILRNNMISLGEGVYATIGILLSISLSIFSILIGFVRFRNLDILYKD